MKKIIPDEGTAIIPLGWYEHRFQVFRVYEITFRGERMEIHLLDLLCIAPHDANDRGAPYLGEPRGVADSNG